MPNIRARIERLEGVAPQFAKPPVRIIGEPGETFDAILARHFPEGAPADRLVIVRALV